MLPYNFGPPGATTVMPPTFFLGVTALVCPCLLQPWGHTIVTTVTGRGWQWGRLVRASPQLWRNLSLALWRYMERSELKTVLDPPPQLCECSRATDTSHDFKDDPEYPAAVIDNMHTKHCILSLTKSVSLHDLRRYVRQQH